MYTVTLSFKSYLSHPRLGDGVNVQIICIKVACKNNEKSKWAA